MIRYEEALAIIHRAAAARVLGDEEVPLDQALGRVAAREVRSPEAVPAFDNSAMDGFAVRARDLAGASPGAPVTLPVRGRVAAGDDASSVRGGGAVEIMTGAPLPPGCDAVVRVEDVEVIRAPSGEAAQARIRVAPPAGQDVRPRGDDFSEGALLAAPGEAIRPEHVMALATVGVRSLRARRRPRVALVSTGKEVVPYAARELPPGAVRNSSAQWLRAALRLAGADCVAAELVGDDPADFGALLRRLSDGADVLLTTGAVSMGRHDYVPDQLRSLGAVRHFHKVAMRPGKPILFAELAGGPAIFALPGNPVSTAVGFRFFAYPFLRGILGLGPERPFRARLRADAPKPDGLRCFFRAWVDVTPEGASAEVLQGQGSAIVRTLIGANGWAILPEAGDRARAGEEIEVVPQHAGDGFAPSPRGAGR